jgi:hypothetical protein
MGSTQSRLRADIVNDMDTMTQTQSQFIDFLTGKVNLSFIPDMEAWVYVILADTTLTPLIPFALCGTKAEDAKVPLYSSPHVRKHSFVALARRALVLIQQQFETSNREMFLSSGAFEHVLVSLQVFLSYKYDGPPIHSKDPTPLWKLAAGITKTLIKECIPVLRDLERTKGLTLGTMDPGKLKGMYHTMIQSIHVYLLCKRYVLIHEST